MRLKQLKWVFFILLLGAAFSAGVYTAPHLNGTTQWIASMSNWNSNWSPLPFVMALSMTTILTMIKIVIALIGWFIWTKTKKLNLVKFSGLVILAFSIISLLPTLFAVGIIVIAILLVTKSRKKQLIMD